MEKKIKIISGGIRYFRICPEYWQDRLEKLKALGCNTVETYIPWNLHEKEKGHFDFEFSFEATEVGDTFLDFSGWERLCFGKWLRRY